jgi:hypothetical protein
MRVGRVIFLISILLAAMIAAGTSQAAPPVQYEGPNGEHQVVICKYVNQPGVGEVLQTGQNPIVADYHAVPGFNGTLPFEFADQQGNSIAVQWTDDEHFSDLSVCPPGDTPLEPELVQVCDPQTGEIIEVSEDDADQYLPVDDPACEENSTGGSPTGTDGISTGGSTGGTTDGISTTSAPTGELPFTGLPIWMPLLAAAMLLGSGIWLLRRKESLGRS